MTAKFKIRLKKGDTVIVRNGKYKGKTGKVVSTNPSLNAVTVDGINVVKRHAKPTKRFPQGGIVEVTKPIKVSKVGIYEPTLKKASRVKHQLKNGAKARVYALSNKEIK